MSARRLDDQPGLEVSPLKVAFGAQLQLFGEGVQDHGGGLRRPSWPQHAQCRVNAGEFAAPLFEPMPWLREGFGFVGDWTVRRQNDLVALCFGLQKINKA
jgi:hypothetical protein